MVEKSSTAEFTVAPGRTVVTDGGEKGPGSTVTMDSIEGERLRARGFFLAEDGAVEVNTSGPAVNVEDGVRVEPGAVAKPAKPAARSHS